VRVLGQLLDADALMASSLAVACMQYNRRLLYTGGCFDRVPLADPL
jgi:hypothetical protein